MENDFKMVDIIAYSNEFLTDLIEAHPAEFSDEDKRAILTYYNEGLYNIVVDEK